VIASEAAVKNRGGRPRVTAKPEQVDKLRSQGASWRRTAKALGIGTATAMRLFGSMDRTRPNTQDVGSKTSEQIG
jgi:DNA invertase Pin-like site-specific DNA recombinase